MNLNWKKRTYFILAFVASLTLATNVQAAEPVKIELLEETFYDYGPYAELFRTYQEVGKDETISYAIPVPADIYESVKGTENPLLETKKELTVAYQYWRLDKKLSELNGIYLALYPDAQVSVSESLRPSFEADLVVMNQHANSQLELISKMSKKEQSKLYVRTDLSYVDYGKEDAFYEETVPDYDEMKKVAALAEADRKADYESEGEVTSSKETKEKPPYLLYGSIAFVFLFIVTLTVLVVRKRG